MRGEGAQQGGKTSDQRAVLPAGVPSDGPARFGFTATKKLGNAVMRNRIRRRLKEMVRLVAPSHARDGHDYVLVARADAAVRPFNALERDLIAALAALHAPGSGDQRTSRARPRPAPDKLSTSRRA